MGWDDRLASKKAPNTYPGHLRVYLLSDRALKKEMRGLSQEGRVNIPPLSAAVGIYSISDLNWGSQYLTLSVLHNKKQSLSSEINALFFYIKCEI